MVHRLDFSLTQDFFATIKGHRHTFQIRADMLNFGNLLNERLGRRPAPDQHAAADRADGGAGWPVDAQGRAQYRLRVINNELMTKSLEPTAGLGDVYRFQIMLRYLF